MTVDEKERNSSTKFSFQGNQLPCAAGVGHAALTVPPSLPPVYTSQRDSIFTRPVVPASSAPCYHVQCAPQRQENKVNSAALATLGVFPSYSSLYVVVVLFTSDLLQSEGIRGIRVRHLPPTENHFSDGINKIESAIQVDGLHY